MNMEDLAFRMKFISLRIADTLPGKSCTYQIEKFVGEGTFGKVAMCKILGTEKIVAVKILRRFFVWPVKREVMMNEMLKVFDHDKKNLVRLEEHFIHRGHTCLVFEMLDNSLEDLMVRRCFKPLCLFDLRVITQQMLVALEALKSIHIVHADIKTNNIMLVNHALQPFKIKLIDFGLACSVHKASCHTIKPIVPYRAPEVILGLPLNEAVDMWALGCVLALMYLGEDLYSSESEYEVMRAIVHMQGQPDDHMLNSGKYTKKYFSKDKSSPGAPWRLIRRPQPEHRGICDLVASLDDLPTHRPRAKDPAEDEDIQAFLSLLKCMLCVDPEKRITPSEALGHPFLTMKHLSCFPNDSDYVTSAHLAIENCQLEESSVPFEDFITSSEESSMTGASIPSSYHSLSSEEETTMNTTNGPPVKTDFNQDATADRTSEKPPGTHVVASPAAVDHHSDGINTSNDEGTTSFFEVKTSSNDSTTARTNRGPHDTSIKHSATSVTSLKMEHITNLDEEITVNSTNEPPVKTGFKDATTDKTSEIPPGTHVVASPAPVDHHSDGINTSNDEGTTDFVEVKMQKKWLKRIRQVFSRMVKRVRCCSKCS